MATPCPHRTMPNRNTDPSYPNPLYRSYHTSLSVRRSESHVPQLPTPWPTRAEIDVEDALMTTLHPLTAFHTTPENPIEVPLAPIADHTLTQAQIWAWTNPRVPGHITLRELALRLKSYEVKVEDMQSRFNGDVRYLELEEDYLGRLKRRRGAFRRSEEWKGILKEEREKKPNGGYKEVGQVNEFEDTSGELLLEAILEQEFIQDDFTQRNLSSSSTSKSSIYPIPHDISPQYHDTSESSYSSHLVGCTISPVTTRSNGVSCSYSSFQTSIDDASSDEGDEDEVFYLTRSVPSPPPIDMPIMTNQYSHLEHPAIWTHNAYSTQSPPHYAQHPVPQDLSYADTQTTIVPRAQFHHYNVYHIPNNNNLSWSPLVHPAAHNDAIGICPHHSPIRNNPKSTAVHINYSSLARHTPDERQNNHYNATFHQNPAFQPPYRQQPQNIPLWCPELNPQATNHSVTPLQHEAHPLSSIERVMPQESELAPPIQAEFDQAAYDTEFLLFIESVRVEDFQAWYEEILACGEPLLRHNPMDPHGMKEFGKYIKELELGHIILSEEREIDIE